MSINRGMDKEDVVYICNGILLRHKKNKVTPFSATQIDLKIFILSEVSQRQKDKYDIINMWNPKKKGRDELFLQNRSHRCRKQTYGYQVIRRGRINWEIGTKIYTLLYIK